MKPGEQQFRVTNVEIYGEQKQCPGRHDLGCRNGNYITAQTAQEAVLDMAEIKRDNTVIGHETCCFDVEGMIDGEYRYIGRFRCTNSNADADVFDVKQLPPPPTMMSCQRHVDLRDILGVIDGYEDANEALAALLELATPVS